MQTVAVTLLVYVIIVVLFEYDDELSTTCACALHSEGETVYWWLKMKVNNEAAYHAWHCVYNINTIMYCICIE